jgi:hypothetical protein
MLVNLSRFLHKLFVRSTIVPSCYSTNYSWDEWGAAQRKARFKALRSNLRRHKIHYLAVASTLCLASLITHEVGVKALEAFGFWFLGWF